jgi:hypothetical protein
MILQAKSLEKLRNLINEETEYRSGPKLIAFFNDLGFKDSYGQGFPSRWIFTDEKLSVINGTPELDKCIKKLFAPVNFVGRFETLDNFIKDFNQFLAFDGWKIIRDNRSISFKKVSDDELDTFSHQVSEKENDFLNKEFDDIPIEKLGLDSFITDALNQRFDEIKKCLNAKASLSVIFLVGSTLEGILLGIASKYPKEYNQSNSAPKDDNDKVYPFPKWTLNNFIDVAFEVGHLKMDVKKFSHILRDFRNYIHPYQQVSSRFSPDEHTALICWQVLKAAIYQLSKISDK